MPPTATNNVRVDEEVKAQVATGLSVSDAVRVPNAETRAAMAEADAIIRTRTARFTSAEDLFDDLEAGNGPP